MNEFIADGIDDALPVGGQGDVAGVTRGDADHAVDDLNARRRPAEEGIALAGGIANDDLAALNAVEVGVGRIVLAAVQLVGDDVIHGLPSRIQRHAALDNIRIEVDVAGRAGVLRAEPAEELIVLALRRFGDVLHRHAHVFHGHGIGLFLLAVVQLVGQNGNLIPAGIEGHAAGEDVARRIHGIAREVGGEIPAGEIVSVIVGQLVIQRGIAQLMHGVGVAGVFGLVAGEDRAVAVGHRLALRTAEIHGDIHAPVGIQGDIVVDLLREVIGLALAGLVVVPARKGQAADVGIGRLLDGFALLHIDALVHVQLAIVVHEVHLIAAHAMEGDLHVVERHGEAKLVAVGGVVQSLGLGGEAHADIALLQLDGESDLVAGHDGGHILGIVAQDLPIVDAIRHFDGQHAAELAQNQRDHAFSLASGDSQAAVDGRAAVHAQHDLALGAVEGSARRRQAPAVLLALHGRKAQLFAIIAAANREHRVGGRFGRFDDIGDLAGVAREAVGVQVEGQVVFVGGCKDIVAHGVAPGRQIAHVADARDAVLHGAVDLVEGGVEPGERRDVDIGILLLHCGDHGIEVDLAGGGGLHGAAQYMGVLEAGLKHGGIVPFGSFDAPGVGAPVVQGDVHVDGGGGHLELAEEGQYQLLELDQLGLVLVLVGQHHVALIGFHLVGGGQHLICIDHAEPAVHAVADIDDACARIVGRNRFTVEDDVLQRQLRGDVALLQVFKQQLVFRAGGGKHVVGLHGDIWQGIARPVFCLLHESIPLLHQIVVLHHAHGHAAGPAVQRQACAQDRPALLRGDQEDLDLERQLDFSVNADLQVDGARIIASARRQGIGIQEHARQLDIDIDRVCDGDRYIMKQLDVKGDRDTHAHAHLADQIDLGGYLAGHLLTVGAALELQEVVVEADLLAVFGRDRNAEGSDDGRLAHQIDVGADGNDAIEGDHDLQQGHGKQILILQVSLNQLLHGFHQRVGCLLIVVILVCRTVGIDDLPQRGQRLIEVQTIAGGRIDLQAHRSLGLEQNGHIQPQESAVHVDVQGQLLLKVQIGSDGGQQTLRTVQGNRHANADAGGDGAVLRGQLDVQLGIGDIGNQCGQGVGAGAVLIVQHLLGVLAGHDGHQQLRLQLVVAGQLAGDGLFDLFELLLAQALLDVHFLGGVNVQLGDVVLGIRVVEDDLTGAVRLGFHGFDFRKQHIASQIAALPGIDGSFVAIDFAVVEYDDLPRLEIDLAGHDHLAGNDVALSVVILEDFMLGFIIGIINCIFDVRLAHGGVLGHVVPQNVGQSLGELDDFDLLAEDAHRQRVDVFRISGKLHAIFHIQGKAGAGGEARFAVDLRAALGFAHGDFRDLQASADFDIDVLQRLGRSHALGQNQADGRRAVGELDFSHGAGFFTHFLLIGGIHGVEGHALTDGLGIAEGRGARLVHAPAAEGIALLGGVQALHRLGQQIFALGKHHRLQLTAAEGFKGDDRRIGFIDEAGVQRHLPVHSAQTGDGRGVVGVFIPCGKDLALQRGVRLGVIHHAAGHDFLGFNARALGDEGHQPFAQHEIHLLAGLQLDDLGVGAGHFKGGFGLVDHGTGGADGQGIDGFLHTNHAQRAAALDDHFVSALDDHLGKLRAGIHM